MGTDKLRELHSTTETIDTPSAPQNVQSPLVWLMVSQNYSFVLRWVAKRMQTLMRSQETRFNVSTTSTNSASDLGLLRGNTDRTVQYQPSCWLRSHWNLMDSSLLRITVIMYSTASSILSQPLFQNVLWIWNSEYYWLCSWKLQKKVFVAANARFLARKVFSPIKAMSKTTYCTFHAKTAAVARSALGSKYTAASKLTERDHDSASRNLWFRLQPNQNSWAKKS